MISLYTVSFSGNCHKVHMLLSVLGLEHETKQLDLAAGEQRSREFLAINPLGQVPVLVDGDVRLRDSQAILVYLAARYAPGVCLPSDPGGLGEVMQWLSWAANEIHNGPTLARAIKLFDRPGDLKAAQTRAAAVFEAMNDHLAQHEWLALGRATVADIACYPYIAVADEGEVDATPYAAVAAWTKRVEALPGFVPMPRK